MLALHFVSGVTDDTYLVVPNNVGKPVLLALVVAVIACETVNPAEFVSAAGAPGVEIEVGGTRTLAQENRVAMGLRSERNSARMAVSFAIR